MLWNDVRGKFFRTDLSLQKFECTAALHFMYDGMRFGSEIDRSRKLEFLQFILYGRNALKLIYVHLHFKNFPG
jgi:hypothetical protein